MQQPAAPITMQDLTEAFDLMEINNINKMVHSQNVIIGAVTEIETMKFEALTSRVNDVLEAVQNRAFGGGVQQPERRHHPNEPNAFGRPSGARTNGEPQPSRTQ